MFCKFPSKFLHDWSNWEATSSGKLLRRYDYYTSPVVVGKYVDMIRTCKCCALIEMKTIES